jgi:hypothetical protein
MFDDATIPNLGSRRQTGRYARSMRRGRKGEPPGRENPAAQALGARLLEGAYQPFAARIRGQTVT